MTSSPCIGLFGTTDGENWRAPLIERYKREGIQFFNPVVDDWTPECAEHEARHLAEDEIILFAVTGDAYGSGSLAEIGFAVAQGALYPERQFIFLIKQDLDPSLDNEVAAKASRAARTLVAAHLAKMDLPNVHVVDSLDELQELSVQYARPDHAAEACRVYDGSYLKQMGRDTEWDYVYLIASIQPEISHTGSPCPAEAMRFIVQEGLRRFPDSQVLDRMLMADGQGRSCESSEMHYRAQRWLKDNPRPDRSP